MKDVSVRRTELEKARIKYKTLFGEKKLYVSQPHLNNCSIQLLVDYTSNF